MRTYKAVISFRWWLEHSFQHLLCANVPRHCEVGNPALLYAVSEEKFFNRVMCERYSVETGLVRMFITGGVFIERPFFVDLGVADETHFNQAA